MMSSQASGQATSASRHVTPLNTVNPEASGIKQTPSTAKMAPHAFFSSQHMDLRDVHRQLLEETAGHFVGPMPPKDFLEAFLPWNKNTPESFRRKQPNRARREALQEAAVASSKAAMISKLMDALVDWPLKTKSSNAQVHLRFVDSHKHRDRNCKSLGVDISAYSDADQRVARARPGIMDFANVEMWLEVKPHNSWDPFVDPPTEVSESSASEDNNSNNDDVDEDDEVGVPEEADAHDMDIAQELGDPREIEADNDSDSDMNAPQEPPRAEHIHPFENATQRGKHTRAQIISYAGATMSVQFRGHLFSIVICGGSVRFMRWDRSCAIVTRAFDYAKKPRLFFEFFTRLSQLSAKERGMDESVRPANKRHARKARDVLGKLSTELWIGKAGNALRDIVAIEAQSFLQYTFKGEDFIIPAPHCDLQGLLPFGRATRVSAAIIVSSSRVVFKKEYWRNPGSEDSGVCSEADVYTRFKEQGVTEHVATMYLGGDNGLETKGHDMVDRSWVLGEEHLHVPHLLGHCIILNEVGRGLLTFRFAYDFINCLAHAVEGYETVFDKVKIMHRDFSPDNVMMVWDATKKNWKGLLIDWDHCLNLDTPESREARRFRTGKWHFLSVALGMRTTTAHAPIDDRESVLHTVIWSGLRHFQHDLDYDSLQNILQLYDDVYTSNGVTQAGYGKHGLVVGRFDVVGFTLKPLEKLKQTLAEVLVKRYYKRSRRTKGATNAQLAELGKEWVVQDKEQTELNNPQWLLSVLQATASELWDQLNSRHKCRVDELAAAGSVLDREALERQAWGELEADWVNNVTKLEGQDTKHLRVRYWDGISKRSAFGGPMPTDEFDGNERPLKRRAMGPV